MSLAARDGRLSDLSVTSAGTANWHVGQPMDDRARRALDAAGFTEPGSLARFADVGYLESLDLVVVMSREQLGDVRDRLADRDAEVLMLRALLGEDGLDLADPFYGVAQDFDECLAVIVRACGRLVARLTESSGGSALAR